MRIFVRLACCAYMIFYIILPLIRETSGSESGLDPTLRVVIIGAFIAITAVVLALSVREVVLGIRSGSYRPGAYEDDDGVLIPSGALDEPQPDGEDEDDEDEDEDEEDDEDEDEDEDYDGDDENEDDEDEDDEDEDDVDEE